MAHRATNNILAALPREEYQRIASFLQQEEFAVGKLLYERGARLSHVYFPETVVVSLIATAKDGSVIEVGMTGSEGVVGVWALTGLIRMPHRAVVQVPGYAMKMKVGLLKREFDIGRTLQHRLLRCICLEHMQVTQTALCNRFHPIEARLCRWLLMYRDRVTSNQIPLTQEFLSQMLGAARPMVSFSAANLQKAGIIQYTRGRITILDPVRLRSRACDCYGFVKNAHRSL
jgi:CRP-like cAMP-binding protein